MKTKTIPFAELRQLLEDLGFKERTFRENFIRFEHAASDTVFVFRPYGPDDLVRQADLIVVRRFLDERGLMDPEEFDRMLSKASA